MNAGSVADIYTSTRAVTEYLREWIVVSITQSTSAKVGVAAMVSIISQVESSLGPAFFYVLALWSVDFGLGVLRAISDPTEELSREKTKKGLARLLSIPLITMAAAFVEGVAGEIVRVFGHDPGLGVGLGGKFVLGALVVMAWEESISIGRNGRHFYRTLRLRWNRSAILPGHPPDGDDFSDPDPPTPGQS